MSQPASSQSRNLAARMGRWSAQHRKIAIFGWLAFCIVAFAAGTLVGTTSLTAAKSGVRESGRMDRLLDKDFKSPAGERVIVQSKTLTAPDPAFQAVLADVTKRLQAHSTVTNFETPAQDEGLISNDGHSALIEFEIAGDKTQAEERVDASLAATAAALAQHPAAHPDLLVTSAHSGAGIPELRAVIARLLAERAR